MCYGSVWLLYKAAHKPESRVSLVVGMGSQTGKQWHKSHQKVANTRIVPRKLCVVAVEIIITVQLTLEDQCFLFASSQAS